MSFTDGAKSNASQPMSDGTALRHMYRITADHEQPFDDKLTDLLELGRAYLDIEAGFLTEITDDTQYIKAASGDHPLLQPGESCPLFKAYCRKTLKQDHTLTVQHAAVEGWEDDAAYEAFGLESYIGAKVIVNGEIYGTFCFADSEARPVAFTDEEETFVELMAEWISYELFQQQATEQLKQQRDQLKEFTRSTMSRAMRMASSISLRMKQYGLSSIGRQILVERLIRGRFHNGGELKQRKSDWNGCGP